jgi:hypothetical protein
MKDMKNNNTNENGDFPVTGKPAHNNSKPREGSSLAEKYPIYRPDPACMECGGEGKIWREITRFENDGTPSHVDYENDPCECIFSLMTAQPHKECKACGGSGEVEETHIIEEELVATYYACLCLRYIPIEQPDEGSETND